MDSESADSKASRLLQAFFDASHRTRTNKPTVQGEASERVVVSIARIDVPTSADEVPQLASWPLPWQSA